MVCDEMPDTRPPHTEQGVQHELIFSVRPLHRLGASRCETGLHVSTRGRPCVCGFLCVEAGLHHLTEHARLGGHSHPPTCPPMSKHGLVQT